MKPSTESRPATTEALRIVEYPAPILLRRVPPVAEIDGALQARIDRMFATLYPSNGLGLAAPQVGEALRLFIYDLSVRDKEAGGPRRPVVVINPEIVSMEGEEVAEEGCLSIPGYFENVKRALRVQLRGVDRHGREIRMEAEGLVARLFQHEIDHLNGVMMIDHFSSLKRNIFLRKFKKGRQDAAD